MLRGRIVGERGGDGAAARRTSRAALGALMTGAEAA